MERIKRTGAWKSKRYTLLQPSVISLTNEVHLEFTPSKRWAEGKFTGYLGEAQVSVEGIASIRMRVLRKRHKDIYFLYNGVIFNINFGTYILNNLKVFVRRCMANDRRLYKR